MVGFSDYEQIILALCLYREARGETSEAKRAVAWTIRNRVMQPSWWGKSWIEVITRPYQFTSFNRGDANVGVWPKTTDSTWLDCLSIASEVWEGKGPDNSGGATHYFDDSLADNPPLWARELQPTVKVGRLNFFR